MVRFPPVFGLLLTCLLVAQRSWGQAKPEPLALVLRQYQPRSPAASEVSVALGASGTVKLPPQAIQRRTGTRDSDRGEMQLGKLLIGYENGWMAGFYITPYNRGGDPLPQGNTHPFGAYEERTVGPLQVILGLRSSRSGTSTEAVATLQDLGQPLDDITASFPANFWAVVSTEAELKQFLAVVFSYRPVVKP